MPFGSIVGPVRSVGAVIALLELLQRGELRGGKGGIAVGDNVGRRESVEQVQLVSAVLHRLDLLVMSTVVVVERLVLVVGTWDVVLVVATVHAVLVLNEVVIVIVQIDFVNNGFVALNFDFRRASSSLFRLSRSEGGFGGLFGRARSRRIGALE